MKNRTGDYTCSCSAYNFPHRFGGGKCRGINIVENQWYTYFGSGDCEECHMKDGITCQVIEGIESVKCCPVWQEFVEFEEIKLGKKWNE